MKLRDLQIGQSTDATAPGRGSQTAVQSDTDDLSEPYASLYCTGAGDVKFRGLDGADDTWTVPANFIIPVAMLRVWSTGTTATGLKGIL